jgi:hypothetical protein
MGFACVDYRRYDQGVHLPNVKVGFQRLKGQKRIEMIH